VGQGDACALALPDGTWWLVDAGPRSPFGDAGESVVVPFFRFAGVRSLESLVLTHADADHTGGAPAVLRALAVGDVVVPAPSASVPGPYAEPWLRGRKVRAAARGDTLRRCPGVEVAWPPPVEVPGLATDNRRGLVLRVDRSLLLAADVDTLVESRLSGLGPGAVLKAGHHGAASSTGAALLDSLRPRLAVISCGARNPFGHPAPATLARLAAHGTRVWRTDVGHALWLEGDGSEWRRVEWQRGIERHDAGLRLAAPRPLQ
jgi:competence protein ComEC